MFQRFGENAWLKVSAKHAIEVDDASNIIISAMRVVINALTDAQRGGNFAGSWDQVRIHAHTRTQ